jgi:hypothetical protein
MSPRRRLPLLVCISFAGCAPSTPVPIHMQLLIRPLLYVALLLTWDTAQKAQIVDRSTCASARTMAPALAVDSNIVHYLMLIAPAR